MLIIYGALGVGGVETFFLRLARYRFNHGKKTKILLYHPENNDSELLKEIKNYADIYDLNDISSFGLCAKYLRFSLPLNDGKVSTLLNDVTQIHVYKGEDALLAKNMLSMLSLNIPITVGFYHYVNYLWGGDAIPYFERINRKFVLDFLPKKHLLLFSKDNTKLYSQYTKKDFSSANTFSIGVLDKEYKFKPLVNEGNIIRLCAVGRLVEFKTYNLMVINTMRKLIDLGYNIELDIFGDGPVYRQLLNKIKGFNLSENIRLLGTLNYSDFNVVVSEYDLFIGTGTAIVQASALSIPSITALDNMYAEVSYGFFCEVYDRQYGRNNLDIKHVEFYDLIVSYYNMNLEEKNALRRKHNECVHRYYISTSVKEIERIESYSFDKSDFFFNNIFYDISRLISYLRLRFDIKYKEKRRTLPNL